METFVLIFKRLQRLLGNFLLLIFSYSVWLPLVLLGCCISHFPRTKASIFCGRRETFPRVVSETPSRGRGSA